MEKRRTALGTAAAVTKTGPRDNDDDAMKENKSKEAAEDDPATDTHRDRRLRHGAVRGEMREAPTHPNTHALHTSAVVIIINERAPQAPSGHTRHGLNATRTTTRQGNSYSYSYDTQTSAAQRRRPPRTDQSKRQRYTRYSFPLQRHCHLKTPPAATAGGQTPRTDRR